MAQATGVDLVAAMRTGTLDIADWAEMVAACRGCEWDKGCDRWLLGQPETAVAPRSCRNRAKLGVLKIEQELA